ncbi:CoA-binding protein [Mycobacterium sp. C31M]
MPRSLPELLFEPRSVVVYGASSDPDKLSGRPLDYLKKFGYPGRILAVNPRRDVVQGVPSYRSVNEISGEIDLAVIVVPAEAVPDAIAACAERGVGAAIVFASGFAESADREQLQRQIASAAGEGGMRLLGPNCLGAFSEPHRAFATFSTAFDVEGRRPDSPIAFASQSGAVGTFTYSAMTDYRLGVRYFVNTGNEADVTAVEVLTALVDADDIEVLLCHMEGFRDPAALDDLASRAVAANKPFIVLKAGRTAVGRRAIAAHTASPGGDDAEFDAILQRHGAIRVAGMEEMADTALIFAAGRRPRGRRVSIVTLSGGAGALAADAATDVGLVVEGWGEVPRDKLADRLPYFASTLNPVDITGAMINDVGILDAALDVACAADETDMVLLVLGNADKAAPRVIETVHRAWQRTDKPFVVAWTGGSGEARSDLLALGIPTYSDPLRGVRALGLLTRFSLLASNRR